MNTKNKITKKMQYAVLLDILAFAEENNFTLPENIDYGMLSDFINHEIDIINNRAATSAKRAEERKNMNDQLRDEIFNILSDTEYKTIAEIASDINDTNITPQMITVRLTQLKNMGQVEKDSLTVPATVEGGRSRKVTAYRRVN